jgi:hypothetical protein
MALCGTVLPINITCASNQSLPLGHVVFGQCSSQNKIDTQAFAIAFLALHALLWTFYILVLVIKACNETNNGWISPLKCLNSLAWTGISALFIAMYAIVLAMGLADTGARIIEFLAMVAIVIHRTVKEKYKRKVADKGELLTWLQSLTFSTWAYTGIIVFIYSCSSAGVLVAYLVSLVLIQALDLVRIILVNPTAAGVVVITLSILIVIGGIVLAGLDEILWANILLGLARLTVIFIGMFFVDDTPDHND